MLILTTKTQFKWKTAKKVLHSLFLESPEEIIEQLSEKVRLLEYELAVEIEAHKLKKEMYDEKVDKGRLICH
jgi:hypothetical protein